jgi:hypothetical protein
MDASDERIDKLFALCLELDYVELAILVDRLHSRLREINPSPALGQALEREKARDTSDRGLNSTSTSLRLRNGQTLQKPRTGDSISPTNNPTVHQLALA